MSDIAIDLQNIGKQYKIGGERQRYRALRDTLTDAMKAPVRRARLVLQGQAYAASDLTETFWALRDVNLQIKDGEVVGIIGRNGAGKSTLLKILSRITEPSEGYADIYGRVGALLEVGTGFHPELTGRENIFLNGAVLGMRRSEILRKFDEIIAFAEVEKFIDTPVKHYSSGMALRLGFSVAAHLEPEILLVDEVLAVGDFAFQKKCLGKMDDVAKSGRTVLLVSHNMAAIANLCTTTVLLNRGQLVNYGPTVDIIEQYLKIAESAEDSAQILENSRYVANVELKNEQGDSASHILLDDRLTFEVALKNASQLALPVVSLFICNHYGDRLIMLGSQMQASLKIPGIDAPRLRVTTDPIHLLPGLYTIDIGIGSGFDLAEYLHGVTSFTIEYADLFKTGKLPSAKQGVIAQKATWDLL
jgi:lipopolysaccharide transport system ATP-binding protein